MNTASLATGIWRFSHPYKGEGNIWYFSLNGYLYFSGNSHEEVVAGVPWKVSNDTIYIDFMSQQFLIVAHEINLNSLEGLVYKKGVEHICERFQAIKIGERNPYFINDHFRQHGSSVWDLNCLGHLTLYVVKFVSSMEVRMYDKEEYDKELFKYPDYDPEIDFEAGNYVISELKLIIKLSKWEQYPLIFYYEHPKKFTGHIPLWRGDNCRYYAGTLQEYENLLPQT